MLEAFDLLKVLVNSEDCIITAPARTIGILRHVIQKRLDAGLDLLCEGCCDSLCTRWHKTDRS